MPKLALPPIVITETVETQLLLRGLPFNVTAAETALFLCSHGLEAKEHHVTLCKHKKGRPNGRAFIEWAGAPEGAFEAAKAINGSQFEKRYVECYARHRSARTWCSAPPDPEFCVEIPKLQH